MRTSSRCPARIGLLLCWLCVAPSALPASQGIDAGTRAQVVADYGNLPTAFEPNQGQAD
jgi:hypothetical protein